MVDRTDEDFFGVYFKEFEDSGCEVEALLVV